VWYPTNCIDHLLQIKDQFILRQIFFGTIWLCDLRHELESEIKHDFLFSIFLSKISFSFSLSFYGLISIRISVIAHLFKYFRSYFDCLMQDLFEPKEIGIF
jgi:hypothetical protein